MFFDELNLDDRLLDALYEMRFDECTPIQEQAIPPLLKGRDLVGIAQTGTGKTAAYLLPVLHRLCTGHYPEGSVNCLIMVPTRELAMQIDQVLEAFSYYVPFSGVAVYGGNDAYRYDRELRGMKMGADIIVATPGRLISHLQLGNVDLSRVSFFVLDEADRMLDMGFHDDIMKIASYLPAKRQTLLFSATMPDDIQKLADSLLSNPVNIRIAVSKPAEGIDHKAYICYEPQKMRILESLLKAQEIKRAIMFVSKKTKVKDLAIKMRKMGIKIAQMHSDLTQEERNHVMQDFKAGRISLIVATDLISRGIDIDDIQLVINYDVPRDAEDYIHRVGRTARAGKEGRAVTLVSEEDQFYFGKIERFLGHEIPKLPLPEGLTEVPAYNPRRSLRKDGSRGSRSSRGTTSSRPQSSQRRKAKRHSSSAHR
ncbi:MAG: DEAD/DEAH box helicase [Bacteroidaceae bacterium]|nr:DEAD/DEAH box helicase [Bacteroidaceae bacterium]